MLQNTTLRRPVKEKHSSLLGPLVSCEKMKVYEYGPGPTEFCIFVRFCEKYFEVKLSVFAHNEARICDT